MTNNEITETFFKAHGRVVVSGRNDTMSALMPYFMIDLCNQIYRKIVSPIPCCYNLKVYKKKWMEGCRRVDDTVYKVLNGEQQDYLLSKMDNFNIYVREPLEALWKSIVELLKRLRMDGTKRDVVAGCMLANILAQIAQVQWGHSYLDKNGKPEKNRGIDDVEKGAIWFSNAYCKVKENVKMSDSQVISDNVTALIRRMVDWISRDAEFHAKEKPSVMTWTTWKQKTGYKPEGGVKRGNKGAPMRNALIPLGYELIADESRPDIYDHIKPLGYVEKMIAGETDAWRYEYIYYGIKKKRPQDDDLFLLFRRQRRDVV